MGSDVHCRRLRLLGDVKYVNANMRRDKDFMLKCKILLPKFNTWERVHLERKNRSQLPCQRVFGQKVLRLHRNGVAIAL